MLCLTEPTDPAWVHAALAKLDDVLVDHAHCEMKAASNALSLAGRHSRDIELVLALTALAREEIDHFERVVGFLRERGLGLGTPPVDTYALELRKVGNEHAKQSAISAREGGLVTRLLVGAIIEARSCERFRLLVDALEARRVSPSASLRSGNDARDAELLAFYKELFACEARHFRVYVDLATRAAGGDRERVERELEVLADREGRIVRELESAASRATVHG